MGREKMKILEALKFPLINWLAIKAKLLDDKLKREL
jgi:hypothetical protein